LRIFIAARRLYTSFQRARQRSEKNKETVMQRRKLFAALMMAGVATASSAQDNGGLADGAVGKVERVYVREATGLFIDQKLMRRTERKEIWVDVRAPEHVGAAATGELFKIPDGFAVARGDLVAVRAGDAWGRGFNLLPLENQVTQLVAPRDSLMALTFAVPKSPAGIWLNAQMR
jgi:hypothetical protein